MPTDHGVVFFPTGMAGSVMLPNRSLAYGLLSPSYHLTRAVREHRQTPKKMNETRDLFSRDFHFLYRRSASI